MQKQRREYDEKLKAEFERITAELRVQIRDELSKSMSEELSQKLRKEIKAELKQEREEKKKRKKAKKEAQAAEAAAESDQAWRKYRAFEKHLERNLKKLDYRERWALEQIYIWLF